MAEYENIAAAKKALEEIVTQYEGNFISSDRNEITTLIEELSRYGAIRLSPETDESRSFSFTPRDQKILEKIISHARFYQQEGRVGYDLDCAKNTYEELLDSKQTLSIITAYQEQGLFVGSSVRRYMVSLQRQLSDNKTLSSKQIVILEEIVQAIDEKFKDMEHGAVYFNPKLEYRGEHCKNHAPTEDFEGTSRSIINYGLDRGRSKKEVSGQDVLEFREKYFSEGKLSENFKQDLMAEVRRRVGRDESAINRYNNELKLVEQYLAAIDPKKHEVRGMYRAIPKDSEYQFSFVP